MGDMGGGGGPEARANLIRNCGTTIRSRRSHP